ncbi:hypothetical protein H1C71_012998, partial [Ictidomys tridecemlineatus]
AGTPVIGRSQAASQPPGPLAGRRPREAARHEGSGLSWRCCFHFCCTAVDLSRLQPRWARKGPSPMSGTQWKGMRDPKIELKDGKTETPRFSSWKVWAETEVPLEASGSC